MKKKLLVFILVLSYLSISIAQNKEENDQITNSNLKPKSTSSTSALLTKIGVEFKASSNFTATGFDLNWVCNPEDEDHISAYVIDVATDFGFTNILPGMANLNVGKVKTYHISNLKSGTWYYYRIKVILAGETSPVLDKSQNVTMYNIPVAKPATGIADSTFTANWEGLVKPQLDAKIKIENKNEEKTVAGINYGYLLDVSTNKDFTTFLDGFYSRPIVSDSSIRLTGLPGQFYYYRIRARNQSGITDYSNVIKVQLPVYPTLNVQNELDFGNIEFASVPVIKTISIVNLGIGNLNINEVLFSSPNNVFGLIDPAPFVLEPNIPYQLRLIVNPIALGVNNVVLHLKNNSKIVDVPVVLKTNITQHSGPQTLLPIQNNYGTFSGPIGTPTAPFFVTNTSSSNMLITGLSIIGDQRSFVIVGISPFTPALSIKGDNSFTSNSSSKKLQKTDDFGLPIEVKPGESYQVTVKFLPQTYGEKEASLKVETNTGSPLYARLYGIANGAPKIALSKNELNFGEMSNASIKYDSIIIKNDGTLNLNVNSKEITGADKDAFSIISGSESVVLKSGESQVVKIAALGLLPPGVKNAEMVISSDDPQYKVNTISISSSIKNGVLAYLNSIEYNNTDMDLYSDTTITIKNTGNLSVTIDNLSFDGAYASDFKVVNTSVPLTLQSGEEKKITVRFTPQGTNLRFARMVIHCTDPTVPFSYLVLKGYGVIIQKTFTASGKISFKGNGLQGVTINISGDSTGFAKSAVDGLYGFSVTRMKSYTLTPVLKGFVFEPASKTISNVSAETVIDFTAINNEPSKFALVSPENNKVLPIIYPTKPVVFKWGKSIDPEGLPVNYKVVINGGTVDKQYADLTDTTLSADIMKDLALGTTYSWYVEASDGLNLSKTEVGSFTSSTSVSDVEIVSSKPVCYNLAQNYPNPFNPSTQIEYSTTENGNVTIDIYNSIGSKVKTLVNRVQPAGNYKITWDATNLPSGLYFYRITAGNFTAMKKMLLMK